MSLLPSLGIGGRTLTPALGKVLWIRIYPWSAPHQNQLRHLNISDEGGRDCLRNVEKSFNTDTDYSPRRLNF